MYDPSVCSYESLCAKLFDTIDPTVLNRVGNDVGTQYRTGIYAVRPSAQTCPGHPPERCAASSQHTKAQLAAARSFVAREQQGRSKPIVTECKEAAIFWPAEEYHRTLLRLDPTTTGLCPALFSMACWVLARSQIRTCVRRAIPEERWPEREQGCEGAGTLLWLTDPPSRILSECISS